MIRSFLAIELPVAIQMQIGKIEEDLKSASADVRWVNPGNVHLTLKFFGNIEESLIDSIMAAVRGPLGTAEPFQLGLRGTGAFPTMRSPRVVWIGLEDGQGRLAPLQKEVDSCLAKIGFEPEGRAFRPHLTLGRVRSNRAREALVKKIDGHRQEALGEFLVEKVVLFRSDLRPTGSIYTPLREAKLGA